MYFCGHQGRWQCYDLGRSIPTVCFSCASVVKISGLCGGDSLSGAPLLTHRVVITLSDSGDSEKVSKIVYSRETKRNHTVGVVVRRIAMSVFSHTCLAATSSDFERVIFYLLFLISY